MQKQRIIWIDNLKAFLIFIVVLGHCIQQLYPDYLNNHVYNYIYSFHMALFMFISGYCSKKIGIQVIKDRFIQLIIPFLVWSLIKFAYRNDCNILQMIIHPTDSLWFLWVLFFISALHITSVLLAQKLHIKEEYLTVAFAITLQVIYLLLHKTHLFSFDLMTYHFIFYTAGYYFMKYSLFKYPLWLSVCFALMWIILGYGWSTNGNVHILSKPIDSQYIRFILGYMISFVSILSVIPLFRKFANYNMFIINKIGRGTLAIYAIHFHLLWIHGLLVSHFEIEKYSLYCIVLAISVTFLSYLIFNILNRIPILNFLLFGKNIFKK